MLRVERKFGGHCERELKARRWIFRVGDLGLLSISFDYGEFIFAFLNDGDLIDGNVI